MAEGWWAKRAGLTTASMAVAICLLSDISVYSVLPTAFEEMGLDKWQVGLILSSNRWVRLVTNYPVGLLSQHWPEHVGAVFSGGLALGCVCSACYALSQGFLVLMVGRCLWGVAWSMIRNSALLSVRNVVKSGVLPAGEATGYYDGVSRLGAVIGLFTAGPIYDALSFSWLFTIWGIISLLSIPMGKIAHTLTARQLSTSTFEEETQANSCRCRPRGCSSPPQRLALLLVGFVTGCVSWGLIISTLGLILREALGEEVDMGTFSVKIATFNSCILGLRWGVEVLGTPMLGRLSDRVGRKKACLVAFVVGVGAAVLCLVDLPVVFLLLGVLLLFFSASAVAIASLTEAIDNDMISSYVTFQDFGSAVGPVLGYTLPHTGLSARTGVFLSVGILYGMGIFFASKGFGEHVPVAAVPPEGVEDQLDEELIELNLEDTAGTEWEGEEEIEGVAAVDDGKEEEPVQAL